MSGEINPGGGWSGDHSFSSSAAVFGFNELIIPEVKLAHPDWNNGQVYQEALERFNLRLSENIRYGRSETNNEDNVTVWRADERDGTTVLVVHGGAYDGYTLDQLWNNSQKFARNQGNPDAISNEEYRAQKAMQRSILSGEAGSTASIIGHPDSVKIFQTFTKGKDGLFYSHQIDLEKVAGRTLTFAEGKVLMAKIHEQYQKEAVMTDAKHDHFMVKNGSIPAQDVRMIAQALVMTSEVVKNRPRINRLDGMLYDTPHVVIHNFSEAAHSVFTYLSLRRKRPKEEARNFRAYSVQKESPKQRLSVEKSITRHKKKEAKQAKKPEKAVKTVVFKKKEIGQNLRISATVFEPRRKIQEANRSRREKRKKIFGPVEQRRLLTKITNPEQHRRLKVKRISLEKSEKNKLIIKKTKEGKRQFHIKGIERAGQARPEVVLVTQKLREKRLLRQLVRLVRKLESPKQKSEAMHLVQMKQKENYRENITLQKEKRTKQKEIVIKFSLAWIVWVLVKGDRYRVPLHDSKNGNVNGKKELLVQQEPSPWILLSIIWHLAAIREQGFANPTNPTNKPIRPMKKQKKKIRNNQRVDRGIFTELPAQGIIFAFGS